MCFDTGNTANKLVLVNWWEVQRAPSLIPDIETCYWKVVENAGGPKVPKNLGLLSQVLARCGWRKELGLECHSVTTPLAFGRYELLPR